METLIFYLGKVIICSGVMFLYYQIALKDKTFHHYNRFYLLFLVVVSLILPLLKIEYFTIEFSDQVFVLLNKFQSFTDSKNTNDGINYWEYINFGIIGIAIILLLKLLFGIFKIIRFKTQFQKENFEGINFYQTNLSEAPFSYFKNLFWKNTIILNSDIGKQILKHEMVHIEQKHSYDKIFIEIITAVFWFNPFFYLIKKEINLIHEYLADNKAVRQSDTKAFAQMLLASHFSGNQLPATNPFLSSNLKKRLKMIQKPKTKFGYARRISALPVLFTVAFAYMVNAKNKEIEKVNHDVEKIVQSLEIKNDTEVQPNTENISVEIIKDTIKPQLPKVPNTISNLKITSSVENSWENRLKDADESDIFLVEGKKVSKDVFIDFFDENIETPNYIFSHSAPKNDDIKVMIYSAAKNSDQLSSAVRNKLMRENKVGNDMFLYMTKMISTDQERENLRQSVLETAKARKVVEEALDKKGNEVTKNLDFKKGRDYDKNPLTQTEIKELRTDAERLKIKSEKEFEARKENMIIFKYDAIVSYVKNEDQSITKDDRKDPVKASVMMMPLRDGRFFVDGKEFTKEELKKYMKSFEDDVFRKDIASAKAPFKSVKMYRTPYGDRGFSKLDKVEFSTK
ncbi:M56 family metallopeptidase [Chryseobacterium sp. 3008163]|uniref:M56 family metallopeptidase n=1 Tax=Chryseobacterium sp. 3008163 TaxID=2478663 RepID=UPI000F0BFDAE|nr:M56 family metallopeptidase [Chryseobacterium sp. 3008163]AYN02139.1 M56 family metallopeptidase [Chryseobacterium sp. 3008163]